MSPQAITPRPCSKCAGCFVVNLADDGRMRCLRCKIDRGAPYRAADQGRHPSESRPAPDQSGVGRLRHPKGAGMTRQLDRLPIEGEVLPPLKPLEEEAQECLQIIENVRSLSGRINRLNNRTRQLNQKIEDRCLLLGAKLLSMRRRVEAGEGGLSWWEWFERFFPSISRKTAERWLRIAATEDPPTAGLEYRKRDADYKRDHRKTLDRTSVSDPTEPSPTPARINSFRQNLPRPTAGDDPEGDAAADPAINDIVQKFQQLPAPRQQDRCMRRLMAGYKRH